MKIRHQGSLAASIAEARRILSEGSDTGGSTEPRIWNWGSGPALLMAPVIDEVNFAYGPLIKHMSRRFRCIMYSPRTSFVEPVTLEERTEELAGVLDSIKSATKVVAWSDAGIVAYRLARHRPELFEHLYLMGLPDRYTLPPLISGIAGRAFDGPLERLVPHRLTAMMTAFVMRGGELSPRDLFPLVARTANLNRLVKYNILPLLWAHRIDSAVECPVSIAWSDGDRFVRKRSAENAAATLGARLEVVGAGGHFPTFFAAEAVAKWIEK